MRKGSNMVMHTNSFDDMWERNLVKEFLESQMEDIVIVNPNFNTGSVGDLFIFDGAGDNRGELISIVEVELMGKKSQRNVTKMKGYAQGRFAPFGDWKPGLTIPPRKMDLDMYKSNEVRRKLNIGGTGILTWDTYARVIPNGKGVFIASRDSIEGSLGGIVNSQNYSGNEERPTFPWEYVDYYDLH